MRSEGGVAAAEDVIHSRREGGALHGHLPVALHEGDDDVLALQPGEEVGGRERGVRVGDRRAAEGGLVARCSLHLVDGGGRGREGVRRGDRIARDELQIGRAHV